MSKYDDMSESDLQSVLDDANGRREAARAEAVEITRALDALRSRERSESMARASGLSRPAVAKVVPAVAGPIEGG